MKRKYFIYSQAQRQSFSLRPRPQDMTPSRWLVSDSYRVFFLGPLTLSSPKQIKQEKKKMTVAELQEANINKSGTANTMPPVCFRGEKVVA